MSEKEIIKYIDLIIKELEDFDSFSVNNIVYDYLKPSSAEEKSSFHKIIEEIKLFGGNNDIFKIRNKSGWCQLTDKGRKLKLSGKSFKSFVKSENKNRWYNENWVGYLIAFIVFLFSVFQYVNNRTLKNENEQLTSQYETYKDSTTLLKRELEKLKHESSSIEVKTKDSIN